MPVRPIALLFAFACLTPFAIADDAFTRNPDRDAVGRLLTYERSNQDGTRPERIDVYRASETRLEVMKSVAPCTNAALVSAELDFETWSADTITGGALLPGAEVMEFAFLTHDRAANRLDVEVRLPDQTLTFEMETGGGTLHVYDFDLASLTALTPYLADPEAGFLTRFALMWPDPEDPGISMMGEAVFAFDERGVEGGREVLTYTTSGNALGDGYLWLDAEDGYIVEAAFEAPNHPGYDDFRLRLIGASDIGAEGWRGHLAAHFEGCGG
ncbi:hypothetical protein V0U79_03095 [Hyphobacterium sp. HN65]|uniref:Uncharacterized protein n=1 Tax=Hyphobacterium lacteum TaxID=3116575 RepID=A0ABU7LN37_9PROT|nr:hypothetical protein [Hyphobacterium sp. HN65]MEE2525338.1 hypothetical protein [Hyphobacterium sp. HN65]